MKSIDNNSCLQLNIRGFGMENIKLTFVLYAVWLTLFSVSPSSGRHREFIINLSVDILAWSAAHCELVTPHGTTNMVKIDSNNGLLHRCWIFLWNLPAGNFSGNAQDI